MTQYGTKETMDGRKGIVIVFTGNGKGKTTAALGCALRAAGRGSRTLVIQFLKDAGASGEHHLPEALAPYIQVYPFGAGFFLPGDDPEPHREAVRRAWARMEELLRENRYDILVLDELAVALNAGLLEESAVLRFLEERAPLLHVIITGRNAPSSLVGKAHIVTEMREVKHHFSRGEAALRGIDF